LLDKHLCHYSGNLSFLLVRVFNIPTKNIVVQNQKNAKNSRNSYFKIKIAKNKFHVNPTIKTDAMKTKSLFLLIAVVCWAAAMGQTDSVKSDKLEKVWEVTGLTVPESVYPVPAENIMYVSNIGGQNPAEKAGNGFISILTFDGKIKNLKWVTGLNAPKGMEIVNGKLFVTDIDRIVQIDIKTGIIDKYYLVEGSQFLNDIAAGSEGELYITDSHAKKIYKFDKGYAIEFVASDTWKFPNGIIMIDSKIFAGVGDNVVRIDPSTRVVEDYLMDTGGVDGLAMVGSDLFVFSDWFGKIYCMKKGGTKELLLDTSASQKMNTADFGFVSSTMTIYVPTFYGNGVVSYKLKL
jgi:sugar lactone lactonase YvrE